MTDTPDNNTTAVGQLALRRIGIDTYRENVAYLHRQCAVYRAEGFQALAKVEVLAGDGRRVIAVLNVVDDESLVAPEQLGLSEEAFNSLGLEPGAAVGVRHAEPPASMEAVRRKIEGERLNATELLGIVRDIAEHRYAKMEIAAFLVASGQTGLDRDEVMNLTRAMVAQGERLRWQRELVADKHCVGGIPGNRTSMLVVPIVAAHGLLMPKTSSRAITSPAGTADTMEVLAQVEMPPARLREIVDAENGALIWGGTANLAPVDDILISVERPLGLDYPGQMVASILSKKISAGSTHLVIDIPVGPSAKVRHMRDALALRKLFEYVGDCLGLFVQVVVTDGRQPVGRGIGPVLEARDVMQVLRNEPEAPADLRQKALRLAGRVLEFDPDVRGGDGFDIARDILDSGRALAKMQRLIEAQGAQADPPQPGALVREVPAPADGTVIAIDNYQVARIARMAGAPMDKGAGVDLLKKLGDKVTAGEPLYRVHASFPADFRFACALVEQDSGYRLGGADEVPQLFAEF
ncbi:thymidine phosphorylase family protein [Mangrovimicrobium sediminis]|uniref:Putative thymidine phosphorylase n=1 Tax=Mangrovimicrobium sediminis TaxID=2562682 RepID=A0A4Z0M5T3_9GAMM|nr:thymidine phosphorylase family protein [Haliea sp. SAOS-164]TGD74854.1 thymidine phosphorylase family protein [Haliea sp. SAOS-164]